MDILRHHQSPKIKQNGEKNRENATPLFFQKIQRYTLCEFIIQSFNI